MFNVGLLLFIPYRELEERVLAAVTAAGFHDLTLAQARVFQRIAAEGSRITDLAASTHVTKQTASSLVRALETTGFVERVPDPADARATLVRVAERGAAAVEVAAREIRQIEDEWRGRIGARRYERLKRDLDALSRVSPD
ncbi:helix-turn-helix domain-containing protein [Citricoccus nitrophenolicus]|uniref:Helix-turn-helix domain-containing protein n=1 Tax=Citricoccus nitrophenolicus TaxID=863575 RepID=A0ABV0IFE2_9MICC